MKTTFIILFLSFLSAPNVFAQKSDIYNEPHFNVINADKNRNKNKDLNKLNIDNNWHSILDIIEKSEIGPELSNYVNFLVWDSLAKNIGINGSVSYGAWQSAGHVLDPHDELIQLTDNPDLQVSFFNSYQLDSIAFHYLYIRNVDSIPDGLAGKANVVDTLFIAYYKGNQISKYKIDSTYNRYAMVDWDKDIRLSKGYYKMDTILLASGANGILDTTHSYNINGGFENAWSLKLAKFKAPSGIQILAYPSGTTDNLVGFTFTFKSGVKTIIGSDTAVMIYSRDPSTILSSMRRTNYFGCRYAINLGTNRWNNQRFFNTSLFALKKESYAPDSSGWKGYVPGIATNKDFFLDAFFRIYIYPTGEVKDITYNVKITNIFPNPAKNSTQIAIEVKTITNVKIIIRNLVGQLVKSIDFGTFTRGSFELPLELSGLNPGIFMVCITAGNTTHTQKLVVTTY